MEITEVRIKLVTNPSERLRAFCSITLNGDFVIRDLKIIEGLNGVFVAMPSRKLADRCTRCGCKNHLRARYCNECGMHLKENRAPKDNQGRAKLHADIAHPINATCRERIQAAVVEAYEAELERSKLPGYKPQTFDDLDDYEGMSEESFVESTSTPVSSPPSAFSEYDSLIADLKREAGDRREGQPATSKAPESRPARLPSEGENAIGKPVYTRHLADRPVDAQVPRMPPAEPVRTAREPESDDPFGAGLV